MGYSKELLVFPECPPCARHWLRLRGCGSAQNSEPALVVLAFRMGKGKIRHIVKYVNGMMNGKCYRKKINKMGEGDREALVAVGLLH